MIFRRRRQEETHSKHNQPDSDRDGLVQSVKRIATMLISSIRSLTQDYAEMKSSDFKKQLDVESQKLEGATAREELDLLHETLKKLILHHRESEQKYQQNRFEEYSKIVATLMEGITEFTGDNTLFADQLDNRLMQIGRVVQLDDLRQIRHRVAQEINKAKEVIAEKKQSDAQKHKHLVDEVQTLNSQLDRAQQETKIDGLTKVYNRRALDQLLDDEIHHCQVVGTPFGVMLFDVDNFKQVNDLHGHPVGDRLLVAVANSAKSLLRVDDFVGRYGGDEFVVVLRGGSLNNTRNILERLRKNIEAGFRYRKDGDTSAVLRVTISGGVAWFRKTDTVESLIERADKALYLAKQLGRNRICTEEDLD